MKAWVVGQRKKRRQESNRNSEFSSGERVSPDDIKKNANLVLGISRHNTQIFFILFSDRIFFTSDNVSLSLSHFTHS